MCCMSFLPEKFSRTKEKSCSHFPSHHIGPLINQQRKIAVGLNPGFICIPDNGFTRWPHDEFLFQFCFRIYNDSSPFRIIFQTIMGDNGTFLCKSLHMRSFPAQKTLRNKKREISIFMTCFLEHPVQFIPHFLPESKPIWLDHHTTLNSGIIC